MSVALPNVDLRPDHWAIVRDALRRHVPDREVLAFGSRATWTAKDYSDLDLAIMGEKPLSLRAFSALDEALVESDLPFRVDIVDWARIEDGFRAIVRRDAVAVQASNAGPDSVRRTRKRSVPADDKRDPARFERCYTMPFNEAFLINPRVHIERGSRMPVRGKWPRSTQVVVPCGLRRSGSFEGAAPSSAAAIRYSHGSRRRSKTERSPDTMPPPISRLATDLRNS